MAKFYELYSTPVTKGIADADSELITLALYGPDETIDPNDGADLRIIDYDGDGLIDEAEFNDATGDGGLGQNGGAGSFLFDSDSNPNNGTLYSSEPYSEGDDLNSIIDALPSNFSNVDPNEVAVCVTRGTLILTDAGEVPVETLESGAEICTSASGLETVRWMGRRKISAAELAANPKLRPVRIVAGALGNGLPARDLVVSRQHRMLVSSKIAERMFGVQDVLISAIKLTELPGIFVDESVEEVEYFHLLFDKHEIIFAEGAPTESLFTGPEALKAVPAEAYQEILTLFPELADRDYTPEPATFIPSGKRQKQLVKRHLKNDRTILPPA